MSLQVTFSIIILSMVKLNICEKVEEAEIADYLHPRSRVLLLLFNYGSEALESWCSKLFDASKLFKVGKDANKTTEIIPVNQLCVYL